MSSHFTVIGSKGFIGNTLTTSLQRSGHRVTPLDRWLPSVSQNLGHVIDCGGLTADFRTRLREVFGAHANRIDAFLKQATFDSYLYLSSTRVYKYSAATAETSSLSVSPTDPDDAYNISKIAGEAICLNSGRSTVRVARLSNVVGINPDPAVFLNSLIADAANKYRIVLGESLDSAKDYIDAGEVCRYLESIAVDGKSQIYNVAYGENRTHARILEILSRHLKFEVSAPEQPVRAFPAINIDRLTSEFGRPRLTPDESIDRLVRSIWQNAASKSVPDMGTQ